MHPRQLRQIGWTIVTALVVEAGILYIGRGSMFWRELLFPLHVVLGVWVAVGVWGALRRRTGADRRRGDRRRQVRNGA